MTPIELSLVLLLARTCVAEIGFQSTPDECVLMWSINARTAERKGRTLRRQTLLYNQYWKSRHQQRMRPWIKHLTGKKKPKRWPKKIKWRNWVGRWMAYRRAAINFVAEYEWKYYRCSHAVDYGAPGENTKKRHRRKRIKCLGGKTKQWYWRD